MVESSTIKIAVVAVSAVTLSITAGIALVVISELTKTESKVITSSYVKINEVNYEYRIALISDDDAKSKNSSIYISTYKEVKLYIEKTLDAGRAIEDESQSHTLRGYLGNGDHGMQLSDLMEFNDNLLTICDTTGILYKIRDNGALSPWLILTMPTEKEYWAEAPFQGEWMTVKDEKLLVGMNFPDDNSNGSEYMHVKEISKSGDVVDVNWDEKYNKLKQALNVTNNGFLTVHGCFWSTITKKWIFALHTMDTTNSYDANSDQFTNIIIIADETISEVTTLRVSNSSRGFTAIQPIPLSNDKIFLGSKVERHDNHYKTYLTVFKTDGSVIMNDYEISFEHKFEGIAFLKIDLFHFETPSVLYFNT